MQEFIVAEISKNWEEGEPMTSEPFLCQKFEEVIETNLARGYQLHSWKLHRMMTTPRTMNETIIAVFSRREG